MPEPTPQRDRTPFLVAFCLLALAVDAVLIQTVVVDDHSPLKNIVRVAVLGGAALFIVTRSVKVPIWLLLTVLLSMSLLIVRANPDQLSIVFVLVLAVAMCATPERALLRTATWVSWAGFGLIFGLLFAGVTQNAILAADIGPLGEIRVRATYGTASVPFFYNVVYGVAALTILCAWREDWRQRRLVLALCVGGAAYFYSTTDARAGFIALLTFVALLWLVRVTARAPLARQAVGLLPVLLLVGSLAVATSNDPGLNLTLSGRPKLYDAFLGRVGLGDFVLSASVKQFDALVGGRATIVDNSYLHLLVGGGVIVFAVFAALFAKATARLYGAGRTPDIAFLVATLGYCASESILLRIENVFIVYAWFLVVKYGGSFTSVDGRASRRLRSGSAAGPAATGGHATSNRPGPDS